MLQQIIANTLRIGIGLVALVDGDDDRASGRLGVVDRLDCLLHHRIIGCNDEDHDVGDVGTARAHLGKGLVTGRIDEGNEVAGLGLDLVGADMLRDAARFASRHICRPDGVEKAGLAVVDMPHHGDDRRARLQARRVVLGTFEADFDVGFRHPLHLVPELLRDQLGRFAVNGLRRRCHDTELHQLLDHVGGPLCHPVGEFGDRDGIRNDHVTNLLDLRNVVPHAGLLALAAHRRKRTLSTLLVTGKRLRDRHLAGLAPAGSVPARRGGTP